MSHGTDSQITTRNGVRAAWRRDGHRVVVLFVDDPERDEPAFRWPDHPMSRCRSGHIAFGPETYPTTADLREMLPEYAELWAAVDAEYGDALLAATASSPAAHAHRSFFALTGP
ncbi:hypothetical protein B7C42_01673 [Nocardia cerradoensis]|uniref:Uncharacterized protein n=1 Tax=Nocardia cerradoensis TaxID=85688 RepID=A0A231HD57_9NOCA|nr:hypothetical protein [Nocardia cerradoensis]OXR46698.1 hypothetical protein B7C42_01673 [Nocardia cerradoensis]